MVPFSRTTNGPVCFSRASIRARSGVFPATEMKARCGAVSTFSSATSGMATPSRLPSPDAVSVSPSSTSTAPFRAGPRQAGEGLHHLLRAQHVERVHVGDEVAHIVVGGIEDDLLRRAVLDDPPALHDGDAGADLQRLVEIVADEDDGALQLPLQLEQLVLQLGADQRIERRERLVHQQDRRVGGEGARQADALLHAAGQLVRVLAGPLARGRPARAASSTRGSRSASGTPASSSPKPTFSATVRQGSSANCWNTMATRCMRMRRSTAGSQVATSTMPSPSLTMHVAAHRPVQPVHGAQQRRLAGAGEAHQHA